MNRVAAGRDGKGETERRKKGGLQKDRKGKRKGDGEDAERKKKGKRRGGRQGG